MNKKDKYQGIIPAFYACYNEHGEVDGERVELLTKYMRGRACHNQTEICCILRLQFCNTKRYSKGVRAAQHNQLQIFQKYFTKGITMGAVKG